MLIKNLIPVLIAAALVNGCDDNDDQGDVASVAPPPIPASDVDFIDGLVPPSRDGGPHVRRGDRARSGP